MKRFTHNGRRLEAAFVCGDFGHGERTYEVYVMGIKRDGTPWDIEGAGELIDARPWSENASMNELGDVVEQINQPDFTAFFINANCKTKAVLESVVPFPLKVQNRAAFDAYYRDNYGIMSLGEAFCHFFNKDDAALRAEKDDEVAQEKIDAYFESFVDDF